nr:hypothetical protein [Tanacetum cinerariifolium]
MLLDKQGHILKLNTDINDTKYFKRLLEHDSAYQISYENKKSQVEKCESGFSYSSDGTCIRFGGYCGIEGGG